MTAMGVAWMHVAHQLFDASPHVLEDPIIGRLVGATREAFAGSEARLETSGARALRAHIATRTRFAEDRLALACRLGVRQYVILGAGMDTFAYRQPSWAHTIRIFEVDQPATQEAKRRRLDTALIVPPDNLTYIAIDFESESVADGLRRGGVQFDRPVFFSWLGVTMYLTEPAIDAVLRTVTSMPASSEIVLTFAQPPSPDDRRDGPTLADRAAAVGEPWVTYFEPDALERRLRSVGFSSVEFLTAAETRARYFQDRADALDPPRQTSIVSARR